MKDIQSPALNKAVSILANTHGNAVLVRLSWKFTEGRKTNRTMASGLASQHNANESDISVTNRLLDRRFVKPIKSIRTACFNFHKTATLPYDDSGWRLLPAKRLTKYRAKMLQFEEQLAIAKNDLGNIYDEIKLDAQFRLNGAFSEALFPSKDALLNGYAMAVGYESVTVPSQFYLSDLSFEQNDQLRTDMSKEIETKLVESHKENFLRIAESMTHLLERIKSYTQPVRIMGGFINVEQEPLHFRNASVNAIHQLLTVAEDMNFSNDPAFTAMVQKFKVNLSPDLDADKLRDDESHRFKVANKLTKAVDNIMANLPC